MRKVFSMIYKVTTCQIPRSPEVAILNANVPGISKATQTLINFILLGTKISIAKAWKQPRPSFNAVKRKVSWIMAQEKLSSILTNTSLKFQTIWEPWAQYMGTSLIPGVQVRINS